MNANRISLAAVLAFGSLLTPAARAISGCSTTTLSGNYAIQFSGMAAPTVANVGGLAVPPGLSQASHAASAGGSSNVPADGIVRLFLDGNGLLYGTSSVSLSGMWLQGNVNGQYTVNDDCTSSFTMSDPNGAASHFGGVIVGQGDTVFVMQTDDGTGDAGILKRTRGFCQTGDLSGTFGIHYAGSTVGTAGLYSSLGILTLDGLGNLSGAESRFSAGTTSQVSSIGSITVNPDCTAVIALTPADPTAKAMTFAGSLSLDNKQLLLVQSDSGAAATGAMTAQ